MSLTLQALQQLQRAELTDFFEETRGIWLALAKKVYRFVADNYPSGSEVRQDDVAQSLQPLLDVNEQLTNALDSRTLKQKYWRTHFCDLIIDSCWPELIQ